MIRDYPHKLAPGAEIRQPVIGNYFALKKSSKDLALVQIQAEDKNGQVIANVELLQGQALPIPREFHRLVVRNHDTETIDIVLVAGFGDFQSYRLSGSVTLEGNIAGIADPVSISELAGGRLAKLGEIEPVDLSNVSEWNIDQATGALQTIVTPAANVNGIKIVRALAALMTSRIMYKQSAPVNWLDGNTLVLVQKGFSHAERDNVIIPAGYGLYYQAYQNSTSSSAFVQYEVL